MGYLAFQVGLFLVPAVVVGFMLGWWLTRFAHCVIHDDSSEELQGLRRNYNDAAQANAELRSRLRELEQVLRKLRACPSDTGYGEFLRTRKLLEKTRNEYGKLLSLSRQQEKQLARLRDELRGAQTELRELQEVVGASDVGKSESAADKPLPALGVGDDLSCIKGINASSARKLKALGILTCQQMAEFSQDDLRRIRRIMGDENKLPLEDWVSKAREVFAGTNAGLRA